MRNIRSDRTQTFLPFPDFSESARCLDYRRLGKQRIEAMQILVALVENRGWTHHPVTSMWKGHELALIRYGLAICDDWIRRKYRDSMRIRFTEYLSSDVFSEYCLTHNVSAADPEWIGCREFHISHQSNLLRKFPDYYSGKGFWTARIDLPYIWPHSPAHADPSIYPVS